MRVAAERAGDETALGGSCVQEVSVAGDRSRHRAEMHDAVGADVDDFGDRLGLRIAGDDEGPGTDAGRVRGLAQERPGQTGVVLGGEVDPDVNAPCPLLLG
jgi:hypothetical protein